MPLVGWASEFLFVSQQVYLVPLSYLWTFFYVILSWIIRSVHRFVENE